MNTARRILKILLLVSLGVLLALIILPLVIPIPPLENTVPPEQLADRDSRYIEIDGTNIHYKDYGSGEPSLLLLHGFPSSEFTWREVYQPLADKFRTIGYDRPAFGLTERPLEWEGANPYSPENQPALAMKLLDQLGIEQAVLVGNSAGGSVAIQTALEHPDRVKALVLVNPAIYGNGGSSPVTRFLLNTPQGRRLGVLLVRRIQESGLELGKAAWYDPSKLTDEIWAGYTRPLKVNHWDQALLEFVRSGRGATLENRLADLALPTLMIVGEGDGVVSPENSIRAASEIPNAELVVIPNCGHAPQEECPQEFLQAIEAFLNKLQ